MYENLETLNSNVAVVKFYNPEGNESTVLKMKECEVEQSNDVIEVTQFPNNGVKEYIPGATDSAVSGKCFYVNEALRGYIENSTLFRVEVYLQDGDEEPYFSDIMFGVKLNEKLNTANTAEFDLEFKTAIKKMIEVNDVHSGPLEDYANI